MGLCWVTDTGRLVVFRRGVSAPGSAGFLHIRKHVKTGTLLFIATVAASMIAWEGDCCYGDQDNRRVHQLWGLRA